MSFGAQERDGRPPAPSQRCSAQWDGAAEPAWGSAAPATFWLALEQSGAWGSKALTESRLDRRLGAALESSCARVGGRALLIRTISDHHYAVDQPRQVFLSGGMPAGRPWLLSGLVRDPARLLRVPWAAMAGADPGPALAALPELALDPTPYLLVCTNARRDLCCAVRGRSVARDAALARPGQVWECSHCGGHRFAPTGVLLPSGHTVGRLTAALGVAGLDAAARGHLASELIDDPHNRGLSHLSPRAQAAEAHVRSLIGETDLVALTAHPTAAGPVQVNHIDGRTWQVEATQETGPMLRRNSCTSDPVPSVAWTTTIRSEATPADRS